jgi:hypothetical protein
VWYFLGLATDLPPVRLRHSDGYASFSIASIFRCIDEPLLAVVEEQPNILNQTLIPLTEMQGDIGQGRR